MARTSPGQSSSRVDEGRLAARRAYSDGATLARNGQCRDTTYLLMIARSAGGGSWQARSSARTCSSAIALLMSGPVIDSVRVARGLMVMARSREPLPLRATSAASSGVRHCSNTTSSRTPFGLNASRTAFAPNCGARYRILRAFSKPNLTVSVTSSAPSSSTIARDPQGRGRDDAVRAYSANAYGDRDDEYSFICVASACVCHCTASARSAHVVQPRQCASTTATVRAFEGADVSSAS